VSQSLIQTKTKILDTAQDLIQRRGMNAMSFQDISNQVGIRKPSIHHHFATKDALVKALLERYVQDFDETVARILSSKESGHRKLGRFCSLFLQTLQAGGHDRGCLCGMLLLELASLEDAALALLRRFLRSNAGRISVMIQEGIRDGSIVVRGDVAATSRLVLAALEGGLTIARCEGGPRQFAEDIQQLLMLLKK
jgi:TetR/AcrR family transcriptional repressor of nem operon